MPFFVLAERTSLVRKVVELALLIGSKGNGQFTGKTQTGILSRLVTENLSHPLFLLTVF
ncbi:hypothetical protein STRDD12_00918 [Streptococcus sp. DD12]|nr:hypothetical protein STRDD12_00918 [Streptococcus sp. DD12]